MTISMRLAAGAAVLALGVPALTIVLRLAPSTFAVTNAALLYLLLVVIISAIGGLRLGIFAVVVAVATLDWFFVAPFHRLAVSSGSDIVTLIVFVLTAILVGSVVERSARSAFEARQARAAADTAEMLVKTNEVRAALLGAVSHDLRTPLASIKTAATTLLQHDRSTTERHLLEAIDRSVDRLDTMVANLLDSSRVRTGAINAHREPLAVEELLTAVLESRAAQLPRIDLAVPEHVPLAIGDRELAERVLANLVDNALFFSNGPVTLAVAPQGHGVSIEVIDRGPGVAESERERIFEPFQRLDDTGGGRGVGLGLAVARGFTLAMGGTLVHAATPGGGATFVFTLERAS